MNALNHYVQQRMAAGSQPQQIMTDLQTVGWSTRDVETAYRDSLVALGMPVPTAEQREAPRPRAIDSAIHFLSIVLLYLVCWSAGKVYFWVIDQRYPDAVLVRSESAQMFLSQTAYYAIAALMIAYPLQLLSLRFWLRRGQSVRSEGRLSKGLTYLALVAAAVVLLGDLITVLYHWLRGELGIRLGLKSLTVLLLAGSVFGFYSLERRWVQYRQHVNPQWFRGMAVWATALVLGGIVLGLLHTGSPAKARQLAFDRERTQQLEQLSACINRYARDIGQLPETLNELVQHRSFDSCRAYVQDPLTRRPYDYRVVTASQDKGEARVGTFELCAHFAWPAQPQGRPSARTLPDSVWSEHPQGRTCHKTSSVLRKASQPSGL